jgi:hypothetical protein
MVELGYLWSNSQKINKVGKMCNYISKEKMDSKYLCKSGLWHQLRFMDIHFYICLWIKGLHIQKSGNKINLKNIKTVKTWTFWKVVNSENSSSKSFSNSLCSTNSTPSKDGGTYKKKLIGKKKRCIIWEQNVKKKKSEIPL